MFGDTFFQGKSYIQINFEKKWVGIHTFWAIFNKLMWSPWQSLAPIPDDQKWVQPFWSVMDPVLVIRNRFSPFDLQWIQSWWSTMDPVLVIRWSTLFRTLCPDGHVLLNDGGHEIVETLTNKKSIRWCLISILYICRMSKYRKNT
jgi:hypothetical protein